METLFGSEFFAGNRAKLRTLFSGTAPIVITAHGLVQRSADETFPFRQDSNFWYLTGIDEPDLVLVMDKDKEYLILPEGYDFRLRFDGGSAVSELAVKSGISTILDSGPGWRQLNSRLKKVKHVATLAALPAYVSHYNFYTNPARAHLIEQIKTVNPTIELLDLRQHLTRMRVVKQPQELLAIKTAISITTSSFKKIHRKLGSFKSEQAIAVELTHDFMKKGVGHAFEPVIASGSRAVTVHHRELQPNLEAGNLVLDVGAQFDHYAADISRTYFTKTPTKRQAAVYNAVLEIQEFALNKMHPGTIHKTYEAEVQHFVGEKLRELGLIKSIDKDAIRNFMPHLTSHSLGIDVHDTSDAEQPFVPGMVWTVEPGIYIPEEGIGVRIEDDVLITKTGHKILTKSLPKNLA